MIRATEHRSRRTLRAPSNLLAITLLSLCAILSSNRLLAQEKSLINEEPFDIIKLRSGDEVKVLQLDLPNRQVPRSPDPSQSLQARRVEDPAKNYRISWRNIASIDLFEQMVMRQAEQFLQKKKFDQAFDNYAYVFRNAPQTPGLQESSQRLLISEAGDSFNKGKNDRALMLMLELYEQNPNFPKLQGTLDRIGDRLVAKQMQEKKYARARQSIQLLKGKFPNATYENLNRAESELKRLAGEELASARKLFEQKEYRAAKLASSNATEIWPDLAGVQEFDLQVQEAYPQILVGVIQQASDISTERMDDWASHRSSRLLRRKLLELTDYTSEGGLYASPLGELKASPSGKGLSIELRPDIRWSSGAGLLSGHDVARALLAMTNRSDPSYSETWAQLLSGVSVQDAFKLQVDLNRSHVRPESLLETSIDGVGHFAGRSRSGPFDITDRTDTETTYQINKSYFAATPTQPQEIVEIQFENADRAVAALRRKQIDIVDKVPPRLLSVVSADRNLKVAEYALPTVHILIPNLKNEYLERIDFRHAICFAINRQSILEQLILPGDSQRGFQVLSGPFPLGRGIDDPLGFAYDSQLAPRTFDPRTAMLYVNAMRTVLAKAEWKKKQDAAKAEGKEPPEEPEELDLPKLKPLILAYPASTTARDVCDTIKKQLELVDIPCQTLELSANDFLSDDLEYDLLYAELAFWEPVADARRLLGPNGLAGGCSPYMRQALRDLDSANNWAEVRTRLRKIHQIAYREAAIIPLWQTVNYFAYQKRIENIGEHPVTLYQNVENWRIAPNPSK